MKFNGKSKLEKTFILLVSVCVLSLLLLCLTSCSGSCFGCSYACESNEFLKLSGCSNVSEGCCNDSSCKVVIGSYDFESVSSEKEASINDAAVASCASASSGCCNASSSHCGVIIGKDSDCGDFLVACSDCGKGGAIGCIDGCTGCTTSSFAYGSILDAIYEWLGI